MRNSRNRGRRYDTEPRLNMKKVFAVIIAILVIIMFIYIIKGFFGKKEQETKTIISKSYFTIFKDDKWGVIDQDANVIIDPSYQEMIVIPNSKVDVFLCTYDVNYETGEYKTKALNSKNQEIFLDYESVEPVSNKDDANNLWYEDNVLKVKKNGKFGLINYEGKKLLDSEYDNISAILGTKNALKVEKNGKYGIVNDQGVILVEPRYDDVLLLGKEDKSGFIIKEKNVYGIIDYSLNKVLDTKYEQVYFVYNKDKYYVKENGVKKIVNKEGKDVLTTGFDDILQILDDSVIFKKDNKMGVMTFDGNIKINPEYEDLVQVKSGNLIAKNQNKYGIIDLEGKQKVDFKYSNIQYESKPDFYIADNENFESDILNNNFEVKLQGMLIDCNLDDGYLKMIVDDETKYYTFKFEEQKETEILKDNTLFVNKKDGKYGFSDKEGNVVIENIYDEVTVQNKYGFAGVKKNGKWGVVNKKGEIIQEPVYDLENYLVINFIGRWHLGQDVNMNYYNQK